MNRFRTRCAFAGAVVACSAAASAAVVPLSGKAGDLPLTPGDGLKGFYWKDADGSMSSLADALAVSAATPTVTYDVLAIDFPRGDENLVVNSSTPVGTFLSGNAANFVGDSTPLTSSSVWRFDGFIAIAAASDIDPSATGVQVGLAVGSDDGFRLTIGGVVVTEWAGERSFNVSQVTASFPEPGLYPLSLVYFEQAVVTGVEFYSTIAGGTLDNSAPSGMTIVPQAVLYTVVPEPASAVGLAAMAGAMALRRRG